VLGTASVPGGASEDSSGTEKRLATLSLDELRFSGRKLSTEHKCDLPAEQKRIEGKGGWVRPAQYDEDGGLLMAARMYQFEGEVNRRMGPGLAIARSLGDTDAMVCGLSATPEVHSHALRLPADNESSDEHDAFLIMASDGIWEFLSAQDAVDVVAPFYSRGETAMDACAALIDLAFDEWQAEDGDDYRDDISATVVFLPGLIKTLESGTLVEDAARAP